MAWNHLSGNKNQLLQAHTIVSLLIFNYVELPMEVIGRPSRAGNVCLRAYDHTQVDTWPPTYMYSSRLSFEMEGRLSVQFSSSHSHAVPTWYRCAQVTASGSIEYARSYPQFPAYSLVSAVAEPQQGTEETDLSEGVGCRHTAGVLIGGRICTLVHHGFGCVFSIVQAVEVEHSPMRGEGFYPCIHTMAAIT